MEPLRPLKSLADIAKSKPLADPSKNTETIAPAPKSFLPQPITDVAEFF